MKPADVRKFINTLLEELPDDDPLVLQAQSAQENHLMQTSGMKEVKMVETGKEKPSKKQSSSKSKEIIDSDEDSAQPTLSSETGKSKKSSKKDVVIDIDVKSKSKGKEASDSKSSKKQKGLNPSGYVPPIIKDFFGGISGDLSFRNESGMNKLLIWFAILLYIGLAAYAVNVTLELSPLEIELPSAKSFMYSGSSASTTDPSSDASLSNNADMDLPPPSASTSPIKKDDEEPSGGSSKGGDDDDEGGMDSDGID